MEMTMQMSPSAMPSRGFSESGSHALGITALLGAISSKLHSAFTDYVERQEALAELYSYDDLMLNDIGVPRCGIVYAVDHGRD
jgi:uncharacterized protein YjiS (DUF1127 family)